MSSTVIYILDVFVKFISSGIVLSKVSCTEVSVSTVTFEDDNIVGTGSAVILTAYGRTLETSCAMNP